MNRIDKLELWRELNATDEAYVRQRFAIGDYSAAHKSIVKEWLVVRDAEHRAAQHNAAFRLTTEVATLTRLGAAASFLIALAAVVELVN